MSEIIDRIAALPGYGIAAIVMMLVYALSAEVRFGSRARSYRAGPHDRLSTMALSIAAGVPIIGLVLALRADAASFAWVPQWFRDARLPGLPAVAWLGIVLGFAGILLRLWSVLTLRERYTRTLLVNADHAIERGGPYRWMRHPGYLGSLLVLDGLALASGNWITLVVSMIVTAAAYAYRIWLEDQMLVATLGAPYAEYISQTHALLPMQKRR